MVLPLNRKLEKVKLIVPTSSAKKADSVAIISFLAKSLFE